MALLLLPFAVPIPWRSSPDALAQVLRRHGVEPDAVISVQSAWLAFAEFLQVEVDGIDPDPDADADGFIVQWGRYSWNDKRLSLSFTRQLAIADGSDRNDPDWQLEYWQIDLQMCLDDDRTSSASITWKYRTPASPSTPSARSEPPRWPRRGARWTDTPSCAPCGKRPL